MKSRVAELPTKIFEGALCADLERLDYGAYTAFAARMGMSPTWVCRLKDPTDTTHINASLVPRACQAVGSVDAVNVLFAELRIGGRRWHMTPRPEAIESGEILCDVAALSADVSALTSKVASDIASDGAHSLSELREAEERLRGIEDQVAALLAGVRGRIARGAS